VELELSDLLENVAEVLEQDVGLLAVQDVVIAHNRSGLHAELGLGQHQDSLAVIVILIHSRVQFKRLLHQPHFQLVVYL